MELYDKLTAKYPAEHFSVSTTQTVIEEESPSASLRAVTISHNGTAVLLVRKSFLEALRLGTSQIAAISATNDKICDGIIAIDENQHIIWYFELKSNCNANRCRDARQQILASQERFKAALASLKDIATDSYLHTGVIATPPQNVEELVKARQRRNTLTDDSHAERSRFFSDLMAGSVRDDKHNTTFCHVNGREMITLPILIARFSENRNESK